MRSAVLRGALTHQRHQPFKHDFVYSHSMLLIEISDLEDTRRLSWLLGYNKWRIFSIYDKYHLADSSEKDLKSKVAEIFFEHSLRTSKNETYVLTTPSFLGYTFNPATFYFHVASDGAFLAAAVEVSNTFGETHLYKLDKLVSNESDRFVFEHKKEFHVSPFIQRHGDYRFVFELNQDGISLQLDLIQQDEVVISTCFRAKRFSLNTLELVKSSIAISRVILFTEARILFQAFKLLFVRKARFYTKPDPLDGTSISPVPSLIKKLVFPFKSKNDYERS